MTEPIHNIIIAESDSKSGAHLQGIILNLGYQCAALAASGAEIVEKARIHKPQIALIDAGLTTDSVVETARQITALKTTAVLLMIQSREANLIQAATEAGVSGFLLKPIEKDRLSMVLQSTWQIRQVIQGLEQKNHDLSEALEVRKLVDRAKGILMVQQGFSEPQAHQMLQKMSQDQGISMKEVCRSVIQVQMILGNKSTAKKKD